MYDNVRMRTIQNKGPSALEVLVGGDSFRGVYVPPLMAEVMKEEEARQAKLAVKPAKVDQYSGPQSAPRTVPLSESALAQLDAIANAPDLDAAIKLMSSMPEMKAALKNKGAIPVAKFEVEDRDRKAQQAASMMIFEGKSGSARYFGSDLTLTAGVLGDKMAIGARLDKLFGYSDFRSNRFGVQFQRKEGRVRTGLFAMLPFSVGTKELARFVPDFTPKGLAEKLRVFLSTPS